MARHDLVEARMGMANEVLKHPLWKTPMTTTPMTPNAVMNHADQCRALAKSNLTTILGLQNNEQVSLIIDCIISAAVLEVAALQSMALKEVDK